MKIKRLYMEVLETQHYNIVHCNMANASFFYLREAQKNGIPVRIQHSHQDRAADNLKNIIRNIPLLALGNNYANVRIACSRNAGDFLFGKKQYSIIRNSIDYDSFKFNPNIRLRVRKDWSISDKELVIGHVGRITPQKNQQFLLKIFRNIKEKRKDSKLVLVGDGCEQEMIKQKIMQLGINDSVMILGERNDISDLLQGMDIFVFPSIYEGLGISILEAQTSGLLCFCSNAIPEDAKICDNIYYLSLNKSPEFWASQIEQKWTNFNRSQVRLDPKYDSKINSNVLKEIYLNSLEIIQ